MNFEAVKEIPKRTKHKLTNYLDEFMRMKEKTVRVHFTKGEYKTTRIGADCLKVAIKRKGYPIDVNVQEGYVYLTRRDL